MRATTINECVEVDFFSDASRFANTNFEEAIYNVEQEISLLSNNADKIDYIIAISSGVMAAILDIFFVEDFNFENNRNIANEQIEAFVINVAQAFGCKSRKLDECVRFLEGKFKIPSDGNTAQFGGGLQHHLRDFAHHPTIIGLIFSLLTQFTGKSFGTDTLGNFKIYDVNAKSMNTIGSDTFEKIFNGTLNWFFHLVSDVVGSSATAALSGGTGLPGPILSLAKEISTLPIIRNLKFKGLRPSEIISKLYNGTLFAKYDSSGKILKESIHKFDLRAEFGIGFHLLNQSKPVIINEIMVRTFYLIRKWAGEIKEKQIDDTKRISEIEWKNVKPFNNPTINRMLTISTGVFTGLDLTHAVITKKGFIAVNYVGIGRFGVALGSETIEALKISKTINLKKMYEDIKLNTYTSKEYERHDQTLKSLTIDKLGLTIEQTEILYNLQFHKTLNDILNGNIINKIDKITSLKMEWLNEWKKYMSMGFSSFVQQSDAQLKWYSLNDLMNKIQQSDPEKTWLRLVMLEAMLFEPYYTITTVTNKEGTEVPSKKYTVLKNKIYGYNENLGDTFLQDLFDDRLIPEGYIKRLRKTHNSCIRELNEVLKTALTGLTIAASIAIVVVASSGVAAPQIATILVGSKFAGLSGAALTSASLAYLGGGAIAVGGLGMTGGTSIIVAGGTLLGVGLGSGAGLALTTNKLIGKKHTILQTAKLTVVLREIFLNDEKDLSFSDVIIEEYTNRIIELEKELTLIKLRADVASKTEKKSLKSDINNLEETLESMKRARKSMSVYASSFKIGLDTSND